MRKPDGHWAAVGAALLALWGPRAVAQEVLRPKVVVVAYFEVGQDTGDEPGELQFWVTTTHRR